MSPTDACHAYCRAFRSREPEAIVSLFERRGVYEMPMLGQRLIGHGEIRAGAAQMFSLTESCSIVLSGIMASAEAAIAEGRLRAKLHRDPDPMDLPCAIALSMGRGGISRLSTYLDARPYRLWSDGPIFAPLD